MSGIEVAGLTLGAFPLLISIAEDYKRGFAPLKKWKRFRTEFIGFINAVDTQKMLFKKVLKRFLISADVPDKELELFMTKPNYEGWQREDLVIELQERLGDSYEVYISTIKAMHELMGEIHALLSLKDGEVDWAKDGEHRWDYQLKRIHLSFSKKGERILASLESHNRNLRELLDSDEKLYSMKNTQKDTTFANIFQCIRRHALSLHTALKRGWNCDCEAPHLAALRLQQRSVSGWSSNFNVAFDVPKDPKDSTSVRREVIINIKKQSKAEESTSETKSDSSPDDWVDKLRGNFESKSSPMVNVTPRPIFLHSISASSSSLSRTGFKSILAKSVSGSSMTSISMRNGSEVLIHDAQTRSWLPVRKKKQTKSVGFTLPQEIPVHPKGEEMKYQTGIIQSQDAHSKVRVACATPPAIKEFPTTADVEIQDLCSTLCDPDLNVACLGYLADDEQRYHELWTVTGDQHVPPFENTTLVSLESLLTGQDGLRLNRLERFRLASILASSLLQLQTTPWLADSLEKRRVMFYRQGSKVLVEHPYISHSFTSTKSAEDPQAPVTQPCSNLIAVKTSLSSLGILLLELCFWQTIETLDLRKSYLGPDGQPNQWTDYMTAQDWVQMVCEEEPDLGPIIRCCVCYTFPVKADWNDKRLIQAVYASVVEPLEKIINKWPT